MCLAVPGQVIQKVGDRGVASLHGNEVPISTVLVPEVQVGDWVLVHAGFAIQHIDAAAAAETWKILEDYRQRLDAAEAKERASVPVTPATEEVRHVRA
jgi:hydrogenase expression/formation protein HypC